MKQGNVEKIDMIILHPSFDAAESFAKEAIFNIVFALNYPLMIKLLKTMNGDINLCSTEGKSLFTFCVENGNDSTLKEILNNKDFKPSRTEFISALINLIRGSNWQRNSVSIELLNEIVKFDVEEDLILEYIEKITDEKIDGVDNDNGSLFSKSEYEQMRNVKQINNSKSSNLSKNKGDNIGKKNDSSAKNKNASVIGESFGSNKSESFGSNKSGSPIINKDRNYTSDKNKTPLISKDNSNKSTCLANNRSPSVNHASIYLKNNRIPLVNNSIFNVKKGRSPSVNNSSTNLGKKRSPSVITSGTKMKKSKSPSVITSSAGFDKSKSPSVITSSASFDKSKSPSVIISGVSKYRAYGLETNKADIKISGTSQAHLKVKEKLGYDVSGLSSIKYKLNPVIYRNNCSFPSTVKKKK